MLSAAAGVAALTGSAEENSAQKCDFSLMERHSIHAIIVIAKIFKRKLYCLFARFSIEK